MIWHVGEHVEQQALLNRNLYTLKSQNGGIWRIKIPPNTNYAFCNCKVVGFKLIYYLEKLNCKDNRRSLPQAVIEIKAKNFCLPMAVHKV